MEKLRIDADMFEHIPVNGWRAMYATGLFRFYRGRVRISRDEFSATIETLPGFEKVRERLTDGGMPEAR